jgi:hypothetical protein
LRAPATDGLGQLLVPAGFHRPDCELAGNNCRMRTDVPGFDPGVEP